MHLQYHQHLRASFISSTQLCTFPSTRTALVEHRCYLQQYAFTKHDIIILVRSVSAWLFDLHVHLRLLTHERGQMSATLCNINFRSRHSNIPGKGLANAAPSEAEDHSLGLGLLVVSGPFCQLLSPSWGPLLDRDVAGTAASSACCLGAPKSRLPDTSAPAELVGTTGLCLPTCLATCTHNTTISVPH